MTPPSLVVFGVEGLPEIAAGASIGALLAVQAPLESGDVVVVTQKIVSKAEGRVVAVDADDPEAKRRLAESEAVRILRRRGELVITETRHGFVCANSGVDLSNVAEGSAVLLPVDPDRSARGIRDAVRAIAGGGAPAVSRSNLTWLPEGVRSVLASPTEGARPVLADCVSLFEIPP